MQLNVKFYLNIVFLIFSHLGFTQFVIDTQAIDSIKQIKEVKPVEATFLFSYYEQDGTKSPVTGGIGNEALQDRVWNVSLNIPINDKMEFEFLGGIDMYSSASTDFINNEYGLYTETSASYKDERIYGSLGVLFNNEKSRTSYGMGIGCSHEYDMKSYNLSASFRKLLKNRNTVLFAKGSVYNDKWILFYPSELRWKYKKNNEIDENEDGDGGSQIRNSFNGSITIEQDITRKMNASITVGATYQNGFLSTPFHRVYFYDSSNHDIESLPDKRLKIPIGLYVNYYFNKYLITRLFYRYYFDDFGIKAHTISIELPIKPINSFALSPFFRYHTQSSSYYFKPFGFHSYKDDFYTSDYDLSNIQSSRVGLEIRFSPFIKSKNDKKGIVFKKITVRSSKYYRFKQDELILKAYLFAISLNFRIE